MAHNNDAPDGVYDLDASKLIFTRNNNPKALPSTETIASMNATTDYMVTCSWAVETGWQNPHLGPYGPLTLMPTASVLHYATECFEGTKCYRGYDGLLRLFRPELNCGRMLSSAQRISLPSFDPKELQKLVEALVSVDGEKWLPRSRPGTFLYLRPAMIGTEANIGVSKPREALLYIVALQFPILDEAGSSMRISRAEMTWSAPGIYRQPGGFGFAKVGANYGPAFAAQAEAKQRGYHQVLWLLGQHSEVTEAGASNFFVMWKTKEGVTQLVTAPLTEGIILDGVTRRSVLDLARAPRLDGVEVVERKFTMVEVAEAVEQGRMMEAFVAGTAYFILSVSHIHYRGKDLDIPVPASEDAYASALKSRLKEIMYGKKHHEWGIIVKERSKSN